jgi:hypothetical protein
VFKFFFNSNYKNKRMTQLYPAFSAIRCTKRLLLFVSFLCAFNASQAQMYYVNLSGASEVPPNSSGGTGKALITISGNLMRVQVTFSGLTGNTTASHIHAPTAAATTGTAGVATTTPTFTGFPLGVKAGTYDHTFDMTQASSYNPAYITANGGTPASAYTALKTAIDAGKSYLNIHSTFAPGGEIRGFLLRCPTMVSIPDAFALAQGVLPNTVYPAFTPASSLTLQSNVTGGNGSYTYNWSNGSTTDAITVSPGVSTVYSVMVHDQNGCSGSASKTVNVMDISGGNKGDKIIVCHNSGHNTLTIAAPSVAAHLNHGDMLGSCNDVNPSVTIRETVTKNLIAEFSVSVLSNPSPNYFELRLTGKAGNKIQLKVYDLQGRLVETKASIQSNQTLRLGTLYTPGIYLVQIMQGTQIQTIRLVKTR